MEVESSRLINLLQLGQLELVRIHNDGRIEYFWDNIEKVAAHWWPGCVDMLINTAKILVPLRPAANDSEDVLRWPDGTWCYRYELPEMSHMSDDFEVLPFGSMQAADFLASI